MLNFLAQIIYQLMILSSFVVLNSLAQNLPIIALLEHAVSLNDD